MEFEQIYITYAERDKDIFFSLEEGYIYAPINVGNVIYKKPFFVWNRNSIQFIYPFSLAEQVFEDFDAINNSYYYMLTSDSHAESYTAVETILNDNGFHAKNLQNIAELEESNRNTVTLAHLSNAILHGADGNPQHFTCLRHRKHQR